MKKKYSQSKTATGPSKSKVSVLRQICNLIPPFLVSKLARETGVDTLARSYSSWSHVVTLLYAQLVHAIGLNDVCDSLRLHSGLLVGLRGATPPSRNNLSHANRERNAALAEKLFWAVLEHLRGLHSGFAGGRQGRGLARRFRRVISVVDSTTIQLVASCMDWAKHRRRKAAAKCHLRLDLHSFLPRFALIDTARDNDAKRAREICAGSIKDHRRFSNAKLMSHQMKIILNRERIANEIRANNWIKEWLAVLVADAGVNDQPTERGRRDDAQMHGPARRVKARH